MKQRKGYETEFKLELARMVVDQGLSLSQVSKDMEVGLTHIVIHNSDGLI